MAAPNEKAVSSTDDKPQAIKEEVIDVEEIDFCSPKFNPSLALKIENVSVPSPEILTFESLSGYEEAASRRRKARETSKTKTTPVRGHSEHKRGAFREPTGVSRARSKDPELRSEQSRSRSLSTSSRPSTSKDLDILKKEAHSSRCRSKFTEFEEASSSRSRPKESSRDRYKNTEKQSTSLSKHTCRLREPRTEPEKRPAEKTQPLRSFDRRSNQGDWLSGSKSYSEEDEKPSSSSKLRNKKGNRNVFTRMEDMEGPLSFLTRCVKDKEHVRVVTRGAVTVSSVCRGYIVAFDKFFNMAMIDVDEIYRRPAALGKVRARASHKLAAAQETLQRENKACKSRWRKADKENAPGSGASRLGGGEGDSEVQGGDNTHTRAASQSSEPHRSKPVTVKKEVERPGGAKSRAGAGSSKVSHSNLALLKSVYPDLDVPVSRFEREALILGIPDENVNHRHINQMLLRGENVVSVSIIEEF